jgi:hypothetical protein
VQRLADLLLVGARLGHGASATIGTAAAAVGRARARALARERLAVVHAVDLGEGDDLARPADSIGSRFLPTMRNRPPSFSPAVGDWADHEVGALQRAAQDARERDLADVRSDLTLNTTPASAPAGRA